MVGPEHLRDCPPFIALRPQSSIQLFPKLLTVVCGLRTRQYVCMRTQVENGILALPDVMDSSHSVVNALIDQGKVEVMKTLSSGAASCCKKKFHAKILVST